MSPAVACQGKEFLFANACGKCPRCEEEARKLLDVWERTPLNLVPEHIRFPLHIAGMIYLKKKWEATNGPQD